MPPATGTYLWMSRCTPPRVPGLLGEQARGAQREVAVVRRNARHVDRAGDRHREVVGGLGPDVLVERDRLIGRGDVVIAVGLHVADLEEEVQLARRAHVDAVGDEGGGHSWVDSAHRSTSMPSDSASIRSSSSGVNAGPVERREVLVELLRAGCADQRRRDDRVAQHPLDRELRERLPALLRDDIEAAQRRESLARSASPAAATSAAAHARPCRRRGTCR